MLRLLFVIIAAALFGSISFAQSEIPPKDSQYREPAWTSLTYQVSKFGLTANARILRETLSREQALTQLAESSQTKALAPSQDRVLSLSLTSSIAGQTSTFTSWHDAPSGRVLQSAIRRENFFRQEEKIFRFTETGFLQIKRRNDIESSQHVRLPGSRRYANQLSDPLYLFNLLSATTTLNDVNDRISLPLVMNKSIYLADLTVTELLKTPTRYTRSEQTGDSSERLVDALRVEVTSRPLIANDGQEANIGIAGLERSISFVIEKETHLPLELRGEVSGVGEIRYELRTVAF